MKYRAEIDGLRALAVLPVILFHAGFESFSGGFVGVDVFFVISGYLITTIIISEMAEEKFSIINFYERRARRILPVLFFMMAVCLPFAWLWMSPAYLRDFGQSLVAVSIFSSNILFWLESGYFDTAAELKPLLHTWSLSVEEQYYIFFPIFLMLAWKLGVKWILIFLLIIFFVSLSIAVWGTQYSTDNKIISGAFFLLPARVWELLIGIFAAFYLKYNTYLKSHSLNQALSILGLVMIIYSIIAFDETTPFPSLYSLIPTTGTVLLILCSVPKTYVHKFLSLKYIVVIGLISYSAYLWHQPILAFARHRLLGDVSDVILIALCLTSLAMAWFSWRFVESPFRNKTMFNRKSIFAMSAVGSIIFFALGFFLHVNTITPSKVIFSHKEISIPYKYHGIIDKGRECSPPLLLLDEKPCEIFGGGRLGEVIIVGDSHARVLSESFYSSVDSFHKLVDLTASACPFLLDLNIYIDRTLICSSDYQLARKKILIERRNSTVVYQARLPLYFYGNGFDNGKPGGNEIRARIRFTGKKTFFDIEEERQHFIESLINSLEFIANNNKNLILILPSFSNGWDPVDRLFAMESQGRSLQEARNYLAIQKNVVNQRVDRLRGELLSMSKRFDNVIIVDPNRYFCSEEFCSPLSSNDELFFTDADHFSLKTNNLIFNEVLNSMEALNR